MKKTSLKVYVLFRFSKKSGKIDTTMTGLGMGMMSLWALQNTTKSKSCLIIERDTGKVVYSVVGKDGFPEVEKGDLGSCEEYGLPVDFVTSITDDRFDE